ncbi:MAG: DUF72 domain-containing protein [Planctomycetota bacterium]
MGRLFGPAAKPDGPVLFGVAGWSYPDWKGIVYPAHCGDTLRAVASRVDLIEINSTFYAAPVARNCESWVRRTEEFQTWFTAKLPSPFTHEGSRSRSLAAETRAGFAPLVASGRCLGFLAQFNHRFEFSPENAAHVAALVGEFGRDAPLFVEVRHRSWNAPLAVATVADLGATVAALDYPGAKGGFDADVPLSRSGLAYFRLHGRNPAWFRKGAGRDQVYDWEYSDAEVAEIRARIERISKSARRTAVVANNHFHGKAMKLLEQLVEWYRKETPG